MFCISRDETTKIEMKRLNATAQYGILTNRGQTSSKKDSGSLFLRKKGSNLSFKGRFVNLDTIGQLGSKPEFSNLVSTGGFIAIRPPITMADTQTPKEERSYSALWQLGMALGGLAVQLAYNPKYERFANFFSQKLLGVKLTQAEVTLANKRAALLEAIHRAPEESRKILYEMTPEQAGKRIKEIDAKIIKEARPTAKIVLSAMNPLNIFKNRSPNANPFNSNPGLIKELRAEYGLETIEDAAQKAGKKAVNGAKTLGKEVIEGLLNNKQRTKQILEVSGASRVVHFAVLLTSLNLATLLVTRYMDPLMKFVGNTFNIDFMKGKDSDGESKKSSAHHHGGPAKKEKSEWNWLDKTIFGALGGLTLMEGLNIAGRLMKKKAVGDKLVADFAKNINKHLKIGDALKFLVKKPYESMKNFAQRKREWLANQANLNDKWVERNVIANLLLRLLITAPTLLVFSGGEKAEKTENENTEKTGEQKKQEKQLHINPTALYNTTRIVVDEAMNLTLLNAADKALIIPASIGLASMLKKSPSNQGIKVITDQGIKNILLICTVMGFLNNAISRPVVNGVKKASEFFGLKFQSTEELETKYKNVRRRFMAAQGLKDVSFENYEDSLNILNIKTV